MQIVIKGLKYGLVFIAEDYGSQAYSYSPKDCALPDHVIIGRSAYRCPFLGGLGFQKFEECGFHNSKVFLLFTQGTVSFEALKLKIELFALQVCENLKILLRVLLTMHRDVCEVE